MKCYYHPSEDAVATCTECGMAMCEKCFNASERSGLCPSCRVEEISSERKKVNKRGRKRLFLAVFWCIFALTLAIGAAFAIAFLNDKIQTFFAPKGKIAIIVIACLVGSFALAALMNTIVAASKARKAKKEDEKLEYTQRKLNSLIRVAIKKKADARKENKK